MLKLKRIFSLMLVMVLAFSLAGCDFMYEYSAKKFVANKFNVSLRKAEIVDNFYEWGFDGIIRYHALRVKDGFENELGDEWLAGPIPAEARNVCEASSVINGEKVINFPAVRNGFYYYEYYRNGEDKRVYLVVLDTLNDMLYVFFASGHAVRR